MTRSAAGMADRVMRARWALDAGDVEFVAEQLEALEAELLAHTDAAPVRDPAWPWRALMLAPTLEVWGVLLRGEQVPLSKLRSDWVRRFQLKGPK